MSNKLVLFSAGAVVLASAVYVGGVYYTGVKVNEYLNNLENNVSINSQINRYIPNSKISAKIDADSFFTEKGNFIFSVRDKSVKIPYTIKKGFGSAKTVIDCEDFVKEVEKNEIIKFAPKSVNANLEFVSSVFSSKIKGEGLFNAAYLDQSKGKLDSVLNIDISKDEDVNTHLNIKNLQDGKSFSINEIEMNGHMQGVEEIKKVGESTVTIKGLNATPYKFDNLVFTTKGINQTKDGDFDLNMTLKGDDLFSYLMNYDIDVTLSKFNTKVLEEFSKTSDSQESYQALFKSLNTLTVNKLNGKVGKIVAFFTGIQDIDKFNLSSNGKFTWNIEEGMESVKGSLIVKSDSNKNAEQFFVEKNGSYESDLSIENGRLMVNGKPFL